MFYKRLYICTLRATEKWLPERILLPAEQEVLIYANISNEMQVLTIFMVAIQINCKLKKQARRLTSFCYCGEGYFKLPHLTTNSPIMRAADVVKLFYSALIKEEIFINWTTLS